MSPELIKAVKERVQSGYDEDKIREELIDSGYADEVISEVISVAQGNKETTIPAAPVVEEFPTTSTLLEKGFKAAIKRNDLILALFIPVVLMALLDFFTMRSESSAVGIQGGVLILFSAIAYLLMLMSALYVISFSSQRNVSFKEGFDWAKKNIFSYLWVSILVFLASLGAFMLLIIPGIVVTIYLYLSQFVFAREGKKGLQAMLRSRHLIEGNFLSVLKVFALIFLLLLVVMIPFSFIDQSLIALYDDPAIYILVSSLFSSLFSVFFTLVGLYVGISIYENLSAAKPAVADNSDVYEAGKATYIILAILGFLAPLIIFIGAVSYYQQENSPQIPPLDYPLEAKDRAAELREGELSDTNSESENDVVLEEELEVTSETELTTE